MMNNSDKYHYEKEFVYIIKYNGIAIISKNTEPIVVRMQTFEDVGMVKSSPPPSLLGWEFGRTRGRGGQGGERGWGNGT